MFELASRLIGVYKVNHMVSTLPRSGVMLKYSANGVTDEERHGREQGLHYRTATLDSVSGNCKMGAGRFGWVYLGLRSDTKR